MVQEKICYILVTTRSKLADIIQDSLYYYEIEHFKLFVSHPRPNYLLTYLFNNININTANF